MAKDSLRKASTPEPFSTSRTSNWVARGGGLPAYIQHIAHDLMEKRGKSESQAISMAIGIVKRWARGGGKVDANTRAAAAKAVAEWEKLKAGAKAKGAAKKVTQAAWDDPDELEADDDELDELSDYTPPPDPMDVLADVTFDDPDELVREAAAAATPMSNAKRRPGESLHDWGVRLQAGDKSLAAAQKTRGGGKGSSASRTRTGGNANFDALHPRGRGGTWVIRGGDSSPAAKAAARKMGVGDGKLTTEAIRAFQRRHGLKVDGVIGKQTASALLGNYKGAKDVAVGNLKEEQVQKLTGKRTSRRVRQATIEPEDLAVLEAVEFEPSELIEQARVLEAGKVDTQDGDSDTEGAGDVDPVFCVKCRKKVKPTKKKNCPTCGTNLGPAVAKAAKAAA